MPAAPRPASRPSRTGWALLIASATSRATPTLRHGPACSGTRPVSMEVHNGPTTVVAVAAAPATGAGPPRARTQP